MPSHGSKSIQILCAALASVLFTLMGCKGGGLPEEEARISKLAVFYGRYISQHKGKTPPSEAELKKFIKTIDADANLDELFVSPRDSEPYVVRYNIPAGAPGAATVTAHEKTGKNGKRLVALTTGEVRSVDEAEFQKLIAK
jgi:hypothetical protein